MNVNTNDFKNQHFVPKCYMTGFRNTSSKSLVATYNIMKKKLKHDTSIRNICSSDWFYGADLVIEKHLGNIENLYPKHLKILIQSLGGEIPYNTEVFFRQWCLILYIRNKHRIDTAENMFQKFDGLFDSMGYNLSTLTREDAIDISFKLYPELVKKTADLSLCLIQNKSKKSFITSDNPISVCNRFIQQHLKNDGCGFDDTGLVIYHPITPELSIVFYDKTYYNEIGLKRNLILTSDTDANILNELIALSAIDLLISNNNMAYDLEPILENIESFRIVDFTKLNYLVEDGNGGFVYDESFNPETDRKSFLILTQRVIPRPRLWPSFFKRRNLAFTYHKNGTMCYYRNQQAYSYDCKSIKKIKINKIMGK